MTVDMECAFAMLVLWSSVDFLDVDDCNQLANYLKMVMVMLKCLLSLVVSHLAVWPHQRHNFCLATMFSVANCGLGLLCHL